MIIFTELREKNNVWTQILVNNITNRIVSVGITNIQARQLINGFNLIRRNEYGINVYKPR